MNSKPKNKISNYFGEATFGLAKMQDRLLPGVYEDLISSLERRKSISNDTADAIAQAVKEWAVAQGATHFCHWFQPMTGLTAEKHDAFISIQTQRFTDITVLERFSGAQLVQSEPDASSLPSGGMRSTFEARGYTAWDPSSPLFVIEERGTTTLCIPSVFFGYHGQALDHKTPLLRSAEALSDAACDFLKLLGDVDVKRVTPTLGAEQEYFLVDRELAAKRPDLIMTGRTMIGAPSVRGQKMEDHYFGSIPPRVKAFMDDLETELYRLGVPVKTRHNEVAPSQFEMAPIFENVSVAADHNTLSMETMRRVANRHGLMCLLHEKPFAEVNGSGKHCNWSISNDKGENLLDPGRTPHQNLRFLAMVAVVVQAVHEHGAALTASISSPGNEHRLGANEAPPAIISVFLGEMLDEIFTSIQKGELATATPEQIINLGVAHLPNISRDYTDRNRTSPFAFTGQKFEFRAVGSSASTAVPMTYLNAAVTDALKKATSKLKAILEKNEIKRDAAVVALIQSIMKNHQAVLYSGNNYSEEWRKEAAQRGLPEVKDCQAAIAVMSDDKQMKFLADANVLSPEEIRSRRNVFAERYHTTLSVEHGSLLELVDDYIIAAAESQLARCYTLKPNIQSAKLRDSYDIRISALESCLHDLLTYANDLRKAWDQIGSLPHSDIVPAIAQQAQPIADRLRTVCDRVETLVADEFWHLPKYRELLFDPSLK